MSPVTAALEALGCVLTANLAMTQLSFVRLEDLSELAEPRRCCKKKQKKTGLF